MPNIKTKKFDFQIFLAVMMILLVICCAIVCCVVGNNENGVAKAYTEEEIGVTNLEFSVTDGFYFKNLTFEQLKNVVSYLTYYNAGVFDFTHNVSVQITAGYVQMSYNNTMTSDKIPLDFYISQASLGNIQFLSLQVLIGGYDTEYFTYNSNYATQEIAFDSSYAYVNNAGDYYFDLNGDIQSTGTFANKIVSAILGADKVSTVTSIDSLTFKFYNTSNLGCLISANHTFANPPVVLPQSVYDGLGDTTELQNQITQLQNQITQLQNQLETSRQEGYDEGYDAGILVGSQFYKDMTYKEDLYRNGENLPFESYDRKILDLTDFLSDAFDINKRWYWCNSYNTTSIGGGVLYYPAGDKHQFTSIGEVLTYYKENNNMPIYCIYDAGSSVLHKFYDFVYILNGYDFSIMLNDGYALGYQQGLNEGNKATEEELNHYKQMGFDDGKKIGYDLGKQAGYNQGVADANDYSFFSLFSAVFDAPITAIVGRWGDSDGDGVYEREGGMLNFYIPGLDINFAPFLLSIFTLAIIVMIIRFILARKS